MNLEKLSAYELIEKREMPDINSVGYLLTHKKTGAKVALVSNDDENKVFYVGFRTPPKNSTGVAHILEHSVLCGSKEFPIKDPFIELAKGSLNTFLNAMTFPDKTVYPIASCNGKDFQNLMHVYLDAVFYPNIYKTDKIFKQEGWHYDMESLEDELTINGVVYNEMKGAFSSPDDVLVRELMNSLYPDTPYGTESGGDPEVIPELSYEEFLDFHRTYYHPSNSYIYLYGDMDMEERLEYLDKAYLSAFDAITVESQIAKQEAFKETRRIVKEYPISEEEDEENACYLSLNMSVGDNLDKDLYVAFQVLDYALCSAPGAPLKEALVKKGIGADVYSMYDNGLQQPVFSIIAKDTSLSKEQEFLDTIESVLSELAEKGMDKKALLAGINYFEFKYREADYGSYPKGLIYGLTALDSWLYDDKEPFMHLEANATYKKLRQAVEEGYFEALIQKYLLENRHKSIVILQPKKGLTAENDRKLKEKLEQYKNSLSEEERRKIVEETAALEEYQDSEDSPEDLAKIPMLSREDIGKQARKLVNKERNIGDIPVLHHDIFSAGIGYLRMMFKVENITEELVTYIGLLKGVLGELNTENYKYGDLFNEINILTGGISTVNNVYANVDDLDKYTLTFEIKGKALYENIPVMVELMREVIMTSDMTDGVRLKEILAEGKSRMQAQMMSGGHSVAIGRALSYGSASAQLSEIMNGIPFYRLICRLNDEFEAEKENITEKLQKLAKHIFRKENLMIDFVGTEEGFSQVEKAAERFAGSLYTEPVEKVSFVPTYEKKNEGFMTSGQVQYVARGGNFRKKGLPYTGALRILKVMMGYDYLWNNIRVKGGAYGCMCSFGKGGDGGFVSYRDPNLKKTVEVFEGAAKAISEVKLDERTMTQYLIGAVSDLDVPMNPQGYALFSLSAYMTGITQEMLQKEREDMLTATPEDIRALSKYIEAMMSDGYFCTVGNAEKVKEASDLFMSIENML
ncbi:MAG: insulinase family protein [Lachnospiraceae bacterium]|nr:insulinase family protein [Lachnospiraceae bacterium]